MGIDSCIAFYNEARSKIAATRLHGENQSIRNAGGAPPGELPVDVDSAFKWWLFVPNVGDHTRAVIGQGIVKADLLDNSLGFAVLLFTHVDEQTVGLRVEQQGQGNVKTAIV